VPNLGVSELIVIFMILLVVFGASRLPALGEGLGRTIRNFKRGLASDDRIEPTGPEVTPAPKPAEKLTEKAGVDKREATDAELIDKS